MNTSTLTRWTGDDYQLTRQDREFINAIFARLAGLFPAWRSAFQGKGEISEAKRAWAAALIRNEVTTPERISRALRKAEQCTNPFLPSVGQFIEWSQRDASEPDLRQFNPLGEMIIDENGMRVDRT